MVFVKVRETYDLKTAQNKMTVIGIHTPKPDIIKKNFPGLLMQCKMYRPVSADVRVACASVLPLDPLGVGTEAGDVAPEDVFNPILYKAMSNKGMSQLEARINGIANAATLDVAGSSAFAEVDDFTSSADEFSIYYGLLSDTHGWRHASPQAGLEMSGLRPLVYEMVYNVGDMDDDALEGTSDPQYNFPQDDSDKTSIGLRKIVGNAKEMPFIPCTSYSQDITKATTGYAQVGFNDDAGVPPMPVNAEIKVPYFNVVCGCIIVPPSRLHSLYFRMVVEWTIEFSAIRPIGEITNWTGLSRIGGSSHYQNYSYESTKEALTGDPSSILTSDACMVSSNADLKKVM